jgi:hypothetical protein
MSVSASGKTATVLCALAAFSCHGDLLEGSRSSALATRAGRITSIEVLAATPAVFGGKSFPGVGQYTKIAGRYHGELDPNHPANATIADITKAPRNVHGAVEYTADFYILRPTDLAAIAKPVVLYDFGNRGNKYLGIQFDDIARHFISWARTNDPMLAGDDGSGFLMRHGYTLVWSGNQGDVTGTDGTMTIQLPIARNDDGSAVEGDVWDECNANGDDMWATQTAAYDTCKLAYPVPRLAPAEAALYVRERRSDPQSLVAPSSWEFADDHTVRLLPHGTQFKPGYIYQFVHKAANPPVMGIGLAAVRDWMAFLKNDAVDGQGNGNPLKDAVGRATLLSFGASQSGRISLEYLYKGFNDDGTGQGRVFDGMTVHVASSRPFLDFRFAQPARCGDLEHECVGYPSNAFPFAFDDQPDPFASGKVDGLLHRCSATGTCPKVMDTFTATEYWQYSNSNVTTDAMGTKDAPMPENVRAYLFSGMEHYPQAGFGVCDAPSVKHNYYAIGKALLLALEKWSVDTTEPPPSQIPRIADGTLVQPTEVRWPAVPHVALPIDVLKQHVVYDYGPEFAQGIITQVPPRPTTQQYGVLVPQVDADGNEIAGIRLPVVAVPAATFTGWARRATANAVGELCGLRGSTLPFAATRAAREAQGDPRLSLEERYPSAAARKQAVADAAAALIAKGFLLAEDSSDVQAEALAAP